MRGGSSTRKLALTLVIAAVALAAPTAQSYPVDPWNGDRLETPTTSRTSQGAKKPEATQRKQRPKPRHKSPLAPQERRR